MVEKSSKPNELGDELDQELEAVANEHYANQVRLGVWVCISCKVRWPCLTIQEAIIARIIRRTPHP